MATTLAQGWPIKEIGCTRWDIVMENRDLFLEESEEILRGNGVVA